MSIFLDQAVIWDKYSALEWLESLGLSKFDIEELADLIQPESHQELEEQVLLLRDAKDEHEIAADDYLNTLHSIYNQLDDLMVDMYNAPRNRTKAYYADKIKLIVEDIGNNY